MIWLLPLLATAFAREKIDYFDNALAKACRPLDKNLDLMFLLDGSGSVSGNTFDTQLNMVKRVIEQVDVGQNRTRIAILQYSGYTKTEVKFGATHSNQELLEKLKHIRHISGTTRTGKALRRARQSFTVSQGARPDDPTVAQAHTAPPTPPLTKERLKVVVVVGDGHSLDNPIPASREIRENGVVLLTMGIGSYVNMDELIQMTEDPTMAFNNNTMDKFISTFRRIAVGEICDFAKGLDGAEIICGADTVEVNIMTQKPFHGHVYVPDHFKNPNCVVTAGNVDDHTVSLRIPLNDCGVQEQFLFSPRGLLAETSVVLMYHPEYNSPKDKSFSIRCFYPDMRYHGKEGEQAKLFPHFSAESLKIEGNPLIASFPVPKMEMPCAYTLRRPDRSCVLEDAAVGDSFVHQWECDESIIGEDYGFHIHSCFMTDGAGQEMLVLDSAGCPVDESLFSRVKYDASGLRAFADGSFVKFADGHGAKFRCSVRFCNLEEGECEALAVAKCGEEAGRVLSRSKRQVMDDMKGFMPPQMVERLFMRRRQHQQAQSSNSSEAGESSEEAPKDRFGRPILQTFDISSSSSRQRLGVPSVRSFRPIGGSAARVRGAINVKPTRVTPSTTKLPATTTAADTTEDPSTAPPTEAATEAVTETVTKAATEDVTDAATTTATAGTTADELALIASFIEENRSNEAVSTAAPTDSPTTKSPSLEKEKPQLPESAFKLSEVPKHAEASGPAKVPMMAGSFSFDDLLKEAIDEADSQEKDDKPSTEAPVSSTQTIDQEASTKTSPKTSTEAIKSTTEIIYEDTYEDIYGKPKSTETVIPTTEVQTSTPSLPDLIELEEQLLAQDLSAALNEEAALEEELRSIEEEINDPALSEVVDNIRLAVKEGEMGMELVGLAVDIVAGLQLGQVQLESQLVRARPPPQNLPSPLNFCPRRS